MSQTTHCIAKFDSHHSKFRGIPNGGFVSYPSTCSALTGPPLTINKVIVLILPFCTTGLEQQFLPERPCLPPTCSAVSLFCVHISPGPPRAGTGPPARADRLKIKTHATYSGPLPDYPAPSQNTCNILGPPSGLPGPGNLYRLPPFSPTRRHCWSLT